MPEFNSPITIKEAIIHIERYIQSKDYEKAIKACHEVLLVSNNNKKVHSLLAKAKKERIKIPNIENNQKKEDKPNQTPSISQSPPISTHDLSANKENKINLFKKSLMHIIISIIIISLLVLIVKVLPINTKTKNTTFSHEQSITNRNNIREQDLTKLNQYILNYETTNSTIPNIEQFNKYILANKYSDPLNTDKYFYMYYSNNDNYAISALLEGEDKKLIIHSNLSSIKKNQPDYIREKNQYTVKF